MASRNEVATVYVAGVIQGIALVTFPAASAVFTNPDAFALSRRGIRRYVFVPQALMAIVSSFLGAGLRTRLGTKTHLSAQAGRQPLVHNLLIASGMAMREHSLAYGTARRDGVPWNWFRADCAGR